MKTAWKAFVSLVVVALMAAALVPSVALAEKTSPQILTTGGTTVEYPLWVAGKQVTSDNANDLRVIDGVSAPNGEARYDYQNNILYLKNATITAPNNSGTNIHGAINYYSSATSTFTIDVTGTCKAEWEYDAASSTPYPSGFASGHSAKTRLHDGAVFTLKGAHSSANDPESYGIRVNGLLTVEGEGKLVAQGGENVSKSWGIYALNLSIGDGCTVEASAGNATESYGVELCGFSDSSFNTTINLAGSAALSCAGGTNDKNSYGIFCSNATSTQSSTLTLDAPNWTGSFTTQGNTGAIAGRWGIEHFTISAGKRILLGYTAPNDDGVVLASSPYSYDINEELSKYKTIGTRGRLESYDVWVGGTQVTSDNAGDVFKDGKVKFAPATSEEPATLTLNGYRGGATYFDKFDGKDGALLGIYAKGDLAIKLAEGTSNTIVGASYSGSPKISAAIGVEGGDLTITGKGTLKAAGLDNPEGGSIADSCGISVVNASFSGGGAGAGGTLTVTGGAKVTAIGGSVSADGGKSYGIVADADLAVTEGAELTAIGGSASSSIGFIVESSSEINPTGLFEARGHTKAVGCGDGGAADLTVSAAAVRAGEAYDGTDLADVVSPFTATGEYKAIVAGGVFEIALNGSEFTYDGSAKYIENKPTSTAETGETSFGFSFEEGGAYVDDLSSLTKTDAGEYTVYVKANNPNYVNTAATTATLTIKPKDVTVTAKSEEFTYDGTAHTNAGYDVVGLVGEDAISAVLEGFITLPSESPVANKVASYKFAKGVVGNYNVTAKDGTLTMKAAPVTITVASASKVEGEKDPAFTGKIEGLVKDGDLGEVKYQRTNKDEAPGTYKGVLTADYKENPNYDVTVRNGDFTIEAKPAEKGEYKAVSGKGSTWTRGSGKALAFTFKRVGDSKATFAHFKGIEVDGKAVPEKDADGKANWTAKSGSVIVELQPAYLETLSAGKHTLTALFDDGDPVSIEFIVAEKKDSSSTSSKGTSAANSSSGKSSTTAKTADPYTSGTAFALALAAASALLLALARRRRT